MVLLCSTSLASSRVWVALSWCVVSVQVVLVLLQGAPLASHEIEQVDLVLGHGLVHVPHLVVSDTSPLPPPQ